MALIVARPPLGCRDAVYLPGSAVCVEPADYANRIEPSAHGGAKIAAPIAVILTTRNFVHGGARVYGAPV